MDPGPSTHLYNYNENYSFTLILNNNLLFVCVYMNVFPTCVSVDHIHD